MKNVNRTKFCINNHLLVWQNEICISLPCQINVLWILRAEVNGQYLINLPLNIFITVKNWLKAKFKFNIWLWISICPSISPSIHSRMNFIVNNELANNKCSSECVDKQKWSKSSSYRNEQYCCWTIHAVQSQ